MSNTSSHNRTHLAMTALVFFVLDQLVKNWIQTHLTPSESLSVLPGFFNLTLVYNTGAAFSLFQQYPALLLVITLALLTGLLTYASKKTHYTLIECLGLGLVIGGAFGNLADRLMMAKVVDYLDMVLIHWPIFNLADAFIFCGICLLLIHHLQHLDKQTA